MSLINEYEKWVEQQQLPEQIKAHIIESIAVAKKLQPHISTIKLSEPSILAAALAILISQSVAEIASKEDMLRFGLVGLQASIDVTTQRMFAMKKQRMAH